MICSLCNRDADQVIRVDGWQVCQWCVSNKVLEHAIEVRANVKKLTAAISSARVEHQHDSKRVREAQDRLQSIAADLETAIKSLAIISEESQESLVRSLGAVEELKEYRDTEAEKTRKARKGS
jgi:hypothetical protein